MLQIQKQAPAQGVIVLALTGSVTIGRYAQELEWAVDDVLKSGGCQLLVVDLANVTHLDSTGIGIIVLCSGKMKEAGGKLRLAGASGLVEKVLRMTQVNTIVPLDATTEDAVRRYTAGS